MICAIVAVDQKLGISKDGQIPWRHPTDLTRFRAMTMGNTVVMGHRTWESLPKQPLPGRRNIVVSRQTDLILLGATVVTTPHAGIQYKQEGRSTFIIGGAQIWQALEREIDRWYVTLVPGDYECDVHIPPYWAGWDCSHKHQDPNTGLTYLTFNRN